MDVQPCCTADDEEAFCLTHLAQLLDVSYRQVWYAVRRRGLGELWRPDARPTCGLSVRRGVVRMGDVLAIEEALVA